VYLRQFVLTFASLLSDRLSPELIRRMMAGGTGDLEP
jgi:hypothetical protein